MLRLRLGGGFAFVLGGVRVFWRYAALCRLRLARPAGESLAETVGGSVVVLVLGPGTVIGTVCADPISAPGTVSACAGPKSHCAKCDAYCWMTRPRRVQSGCRLIAGLFRPC